VRPSYHHCLSEITLGLVVILAFKTVYTLEQKRRDNDKKIISLFVGMRDMMGVLLMYVITRSDSGTARFRYTDIPAASGPWKTISSSDRMAEVSRIV
jgi:hypothetical protein